MIDDLVPIYHVRAYLNSLVGTGWLWT